MILTDAFLSLFFLAQENTNPGDPASLLYYGTLIILIISMTYFMVIRPQKKEEEEKKKMITSLSKGDQVITLSGMHGKIVEFRDNNETVLINVAKDTNILFNSSTIVKKKQ